MERSFDPIVEMYAGSRAYGTSLPSSDVDIRGLFCAEEKYIRTPFFTEKEITISDEEDTKFYEMTHFTRLCLECNPNIVEMLWTDESDIIKSTPAYQLLRDNREAFLSSKIAFTTSGYAFAQLKRIKGHNKWINNPQPEEEPKQFDYVSVSSAFTDDSFDIHRYRDGYRLGRYGKDVYGVYADKTCQLYNETSGQLNVSDWTAPSGTVPLFIIRFNLEHYRTDKESHTKYWQWKNNRNETRSELEERFGYDTKHAMHLVRLLRMGEEALTGKGIVVRRPDAQELLEIRAGKWTYDELYEYAHEMERNIMKKLYHETALPKYANLDEVANILMKAQDLCWSNA